MTETKKRRFGTSRKTKILKQKGNNSIIEWQSADFPQISRLLFFSIKCLVQLQNSPNDIKSTFMTNAKIHLPKKGYKGIRESTQILHL